ncbi:MAG: hypothetical protein KJO34_00035 [Deltaproteobacteria bacterium]|nr:hypothetical protein [Deltaproteobacteria bacterium]
MLLWDKKKDIIMFANDRPGVDALVKKMSRIDAELTIFESTGGYESAINRIGRAFWNLLSSHYKLHWY